MMLVADTATSRWLASAPALQWDEHNTNHIKQRHGFTVGDVEILLSGPFYFRGRIVEPMHTEERWILTGKVGAKYVTLVFTRRGQLLRPISCRSARKKEKEAYEKAR